MNVRPPAPGVPRIVAFMIATAVTAIVAGVGVVLWLAAGMAW